jgi:hypothetical protein
MRSKVVKTMALAMLLCGAAIAQQPGISDQGGKDDKASARAKQKASAEKSKLEEMLAEALKNNPDIRFAAAKLAEANAELNRTRLQVMQKVVTLHYAIETQKKTIAHQQSVCQALQKRYQSGTAGREVFAEATQALTLAKAKLEELEAQLPALLGKTAQEESLFYQYIQQAKLWRKESAEWEKAHRAIGSMAEKIRKALQTPVTVDYKEMTLDAILDNLALRVAGVSFRLVHMTPEKKINLSFKEALPLSAVLQALADEVGCVFYVREYGILATNPDEAPPGAMKVEEFLRQKPADESRPPSSSGKNPPENNVEGLVKSVDASGLIKISIGSDAGLAKGRTLELFRLNPQSPKQSKYLGTIRILEVEAKESIAQAVGRLVDKPKTGDRVTGNISEK